MIEYTHQTILWNEITNSYYYTEYEGNNERLKKLLEVLGYDYSSNDENEDDILSKIKNEYFEDEIDINVERYWTESEMTNSLQRDMREIEDRKYTNLERLSLCNTTLYNLLEDKLNMIYETSRSGSCLFDINHLSYLKYIELLIHRLEKRKYLFIYEELHNDNNYTNNRIKKYLEYYWDKD